MSAPKPIVRWIRANGIEFAYLEQGQGPLVLCLHGFPDTAWGFAPLLPLLAAAGYRVVAPFMRGYAPSGFARDGDYRVTALAADAAALVEALGAEKAYLLGHDWGAATSYAAATLYPERFHCIATAAVPHLRRFSFWPSAKQLYRSRYMGFFQLRGRAERTVVADDFAWLRALIREWSPDWDFSDADFEPLRAGFSDPQRLSAALAYYRALPGSLSNREDLKLLFKPVPVPALVIRAANDGCIGPEMFEEQEKCFGAGYELKTMEGAGHFMQCEQPGHFAEIVLEFFGRHR